nr:MAG TPA: hypothetical protein [Caudoviricetes sp.]
MRTPKWSAILAAVARAGVQESLDNSLKANARIKK